MVSHRILLPLSWNRISDEEPGNAGHEVRPDQPETRGVS
jgi:hypothetical protein